jgi:prepilin-type processing-associated H-X9-DG protein
MVLRCKNRRWFGIGHVAYTRVDAVVVLCLTVGLALILAIVSRSSLTPKARRLRCLANMNQLMKAVSMYTPDNHDFFPPNPDDGNSLPGYDWCPGQFEVTFDSDILADPRYCLVAPYLQANTAVFRCTADPRMGLYPRGGTNASKKGLIVPAARTVSMNGAVGTIDPGFDAGHPHSGSPSLSVNGPWLDGSHNHRRNNPWRTYARTSEVVGPTPANLFVLLEESPNGLDDACFALRMNVPDWLNYPAGLHQGGGNLGFADGHAEFHKWLNPVVTRRHWTFRYWPPAIRSEPIYSFNPLRTNLDWVWLSQRTSAQAASGTQPPP